MAGESLIDAVRAAVAVQDFASATSLAETAIADGVEDVLIYQLAALRRFENGDPQGAAAVLLRATELSPGDAGLLGAAADALRQIGRLDEALALYDSSVKRDPGAVASWYGQGLALEAAGRPSQAMASYRQVSLLAPETAPGHAGLASASLSLGHVNEARRFAAHALTLSPDDPVAKLAMARCAMIEGAFEEVVERLARSGPDDIQALTLKGDALDRLGRHDEAFHAYEAANRSFARICGTAADEVEGQDHVTVIEAALHHFSAGRWTRSAPAIHGAAARHVFLVGFPRSGTTLAEQMLASLDDVVTLEEAPTLADAEYLLYPDGLPQLDGLSDETVAELRAAYWRRVREGGVDPAGKTFVDMDPSKSVALPLIARLFPEAKLVVMHRDPRDVIWSCFRRNFVANAVTAHFTSIDRAARHYGATMALVRSSLAHLPLTAHVLVYERLVHDIDATTQALCAFLGLTWSPAMRDFSATARTRGVRTASAAQVRRGLFDGSGQWQSHAKRLEPVMDLLKPWIDPASLTGTGQG